MKQILRSVFGLHTDTVLIAEPDQALRRLEYRALSGKYRIIQTASVEEAVRIAARHTTGIDLLVTEMRLPHGFGWELTELLKLDYPDLKVVCRIWNFTSLGVVPLPPLPRLSAQSWRYQVLNASSRSQ